MFHFLKIKQMCDCKNIEIGSYKNQVELICWWNSSIISVDKCLCEEILFLWENKIRTTGCCCGHNKAKSMINVIESGHDAMLRLGYKYWVNEYGVKCFLPKSINDYEIK